MASLMRSAILKAIVAAFLISASVPAVTARPVSPDVEVESSPYWDTAPKFKPARALPPLYPRSYIREHKPGWAVVTYTVGIDGRAKNVVLESTSDETFGRHIAAAIRIWPHVPAMKDGVPVEGTVTRKFSLEFE